MKALEVHTKMLDHVRGQIAVGAIGNRVMAVAGQEKIHANAYVSGARAHCGGHVLVVTPEQKTFVLGDGYANWTREATPDEIVGLPDTRGNNRGPSGPDDWLGEA